MLIAIVLGASAQQYMHVWSDGAWVSWPVLNVDSITFTDGPLENVPNEPLEPAQGIGVFSVGEGKTVTFSPGNLQYTQSTNTWSFAENQWEMLGTDNVTGGYVESDPTKGDSKEGTALADKIDLFGLSTSTNNFGVSTSIDENDYSGSFIDWGTNKIGDDAPNTWRTMTFEEWRYLTYERENYSLLCGVAQICGVNGLILLPDNWVCPSGITFKHGFHSNYGVDYFAAYQTFSAEQWSKMEAAGAVFLPAAGSRYGTRMASVGYDGIHWSITNNEVCCYFLHITSYLIIGGCNNRYLGFSVRLVKDVEGEITEPEIPTNTENGHEYVDLGLSVKWATCNVGASQPEEYGDYFAWGETQTDAAYNWNLYEWCLGTDTSISKYCTDSFYGTVDGKTVLEASDDVATVKWGGAWRMPTKEEQDELRERCTCTWTTQNGVNGYQVTGPNGNSIFLPAAGYCFDSSIENVGSYGYYWSSSLFTNDSRRAYELAFYSDVVGWSEVNRNYGQSVRPVCQ